jgi:hypothetical protein
LLTVLLESHQLKEETVTKELAAWIATQSYRIDPATMNSMN